MPSSKSVFVSYATEHRDLADRIALALRGRGFRVFFDKDDLPVGGDYDQRIHKAIQTSSVFVFLISPEAVAEGRYTLTELKFARAKWPHPERSVLPVMVAKTDFKRIPEYLKAITILEPQGSVAAEVGAAVETLLKRPSLVPKLITKASSLLNINLHLGDYLKGGVGKSLAYANADLDEIILKRQIEQGGRITAGELKDKLKSKTKLKNPMLLCVNGVFFPGALLSFGWWERTSRELARNIEWKDRSLQQWLFSGFEQWAPSWDVNDWSAENPFKLVGQIGENDEADSIPVLVKSNRKAKAIRDDLMGSLVTQANVIGLLCHESHLDGLHSLDETDARFLKVIRELTSAQYYLLLLDDVRSHKIEILSEKVEYYSGYIWQCWAPQEWTPENAYDTSLPRAYFVWEHTNLADKDVIQYGLDSLDMKVNYLRRRLQQNMDLSGDLVLLQHLMSNQRLRGEEGGAVPAIPTEHFRSLFLSREAVLA